uniref:Transmembrane protein n=1 Tax=Panagrellus redivivus TaxID=6233 RepID=A0A7E4WBN1_PANRE
MSAPPSTAPVDPVAIWLHSQVVNENNHSDSTLQKFVKKTSIGERYDGTRSAAWTMLSELGTTNRNLFLNKLIRNWPYANERRAMIYPLHVGVLSTVFSASVVACKISSDMFFFNPKMSYFEAVRKCPKTPLVFAVYTSGITFFAFYSVLIMKPFMAEDDPCPSCALSRFCAVMVASGCIFPAATTPALAHYINVHRNPKYPAATNFLESLTLFVTASRPSWSILPKLAILQIAVASACTYSMLWARERIFSTIDAEPESLHDAILKAQAEPSTMDKINKIIGKIPIIGRLVPQDNTE